MCPGVAAGSSSPAGAPGGGGPGPDPRPPPARGPGPSTVGPSHECPPLPAAGPLAPRCGRAVPSTALPCPAAPGDHDGPGRPARAGSAPSGATRRWHPRRGPGRHTHADTHDSDDADDTRRTLEETCTSQPLHQVAARGHSVAGWHLVKWVRRTRPLGLGRATVTGSNPVRS
jgi:hypothetical protein